VLFDFTLCFSSGQLAELRITIRKVQHGGHRRGARFATSGVTTRWLIHFYAINPLVDRADNIPLAQRLSLPIYHRHLS